MLLLKYVTMPHILSRVQHHGRQLEIQPCRNIQLAMRCRNGLFEKKPFEELTKKMQILKLAVPGFGNA